MEQEHKPLDSNNFETCPHCRGQILTEHQLEHVAARAAEKAVELFRNQFYRGVGAAVINRTLWLLGFIIVSIAFWLSSRGILK